MGNCVQEAFVSGKGQELPACAIRGILGKSVPVSTAMMPN